MSLCRILIVRYSRFAPRTSRDSFLTIVPAPWCGYTTLSPTLYKPFLPFCRRFTGKRAGALGAGPELRSLAKIAWKCHFWPFSGLQLQIAVDEVVLLEPAQALTDLARPHRAHTVDALEIALRGADDRVEGAEIPDDLADHRLRQARDVREDAVAPRLDRVVERVDAAGVAEQLRQPVEVEEILVARARRPLERDASPRRPAPTA